MRFGPAREVAAALCLVCTAVVADPPAAEFIGEFEWRNDAPWFGGFSGLSLSPDGSRMTAISDRGTFVTATIVRTGNRITAVNDVQSTQLKSSTGAPLTSRISDSEGLAIASDGTIYISFERIHRVAGYDTPDAPARVLSNLPAFRHLPRNGSFEALAIDPDDRLYTLAEDGLDPQGKIPVFRWNGVAWSVPFVLQPHGDFLPVGADIGPDGRFYLLERDFGLLGFRNRLRRWDMTEAGPANERTLLETGSWTHDNLEGLSVWRDQAGRLRATMIADDNFVFFLSTDIVEYALPD